jgi:hypothetical protein
VRSDTGRGASRAVVLLRQVVHDLPAVVLDEGVGVGVVEPVRLPRDLRSATEPEVVPVTVEPSGSVLRMSALGSFHTTRCSGVRV